MTVVEVWVFDPIVEDKTVVVDSVAVVDVGVVDPDDSVVED